MDPRTKPTDAEMKTWTEKMGRGPYGLLIITKEGGVSMAPRQLIAEFLTNLVAALIAALFLARFRGSLFSRVGIVVLLPLFAFFSVAASHWIWYKFPSAFVLAELATEVISWALAGVAMAKLVPPEPAV